MFQLPAAYISKAHTTIGISRIFELHYRKIVKNEVADIRTNGGHLIGDWYPNAGSVFQILIALTAGQPRFALVFCWWFLTRSTTSNLPTIVAICGLVRSVTCGGWVYITSSDDHDAHDVLMVSYMRFFLAIVPMVYFFVQHKVHLVWLCEWFLIMTDVWFDSITANDFSVLEVVLSKRSSVMEHTQPLSLESPPPQSSHADLKTQVSSDSTRPHMSLRNAFRVRLGAPQSLQHICSFLADVYLAYMWWSIFTALLSFSGQEVSLFATVSPILLGMTSVRTSLSTHSGRTWLQILSVLGLVAYKIEHPLLRLLAVTCANVSGSLLRAIEWGNQQEAEKHGIILGRMEQNWHSFGCFAVQDYATRDLPDGISRGQNGLTTPSENDVDSSSMATENPAANPSDSVVPNTGLFEHWAWPLLPYYWPFPGLHGYLTLMAMALGISISNSTVKAVVCHPIWMIFGALSSYLMYQWRDWPGYIAGLCLSVFLTSLIPVIIRIASLNGKHSPGKVYCTAWLFVCFLDFANVWTVAYAFVPAGWVLRERTDIPHYSNGALGMGLVPEWWRSSLTIPSILPSTLNETVVGLVLVSVSFLATTTLFSTPTPRPHHADQRLITAGIWTVHFGIDDAGRESQYRMRDLINTRVISEDLGYYVDIGPGPNSHTWFPILSSTHHLLPSPHGELAPAISAVLDEDALDRELQSTELARIMASIYPDPAIFLGYVVSQPLAARRILLQELQVGKFVLPKLGHPVIEAPREELTYESF
ncbi:hypothetical protein JB92DRAFT_3028987, partial [Gautieria morchelliformis]